MDDQQTKKCVLMKHGLCISGRSVGTCCYNMINNPGTNKNYDIDPVGCKVCLDQEDNHIYSYRQGANQKYGFDFAPNSLLVIDLSPNFNCNLTCKICNEHVSSSWAKLKKIKINQSTSVDVDEFVSRLSGFDLSTLAEINFSGGEPWLNNNIQRYIDTLEDQVDLSKITLRFSTNGTHKFGQRLDKFFKKFRFVQARFSLDDIGQWHEYQRPPSVWSEWEQNWNYFLEHLPHNVVPSINRTVGLLNIARLDQLDQWAEKHNATKFGDKIELVDHFAFGVYSLNNLSDQHKQYVLDNQGPDSRAWNYVKNRDTVDRLAVVRQHITQQDQLQRTSLKTVDSMLYNIIFNATNTCSS